MSYIYDNLTRSPSGYSGKRTIQSRTYAYTPLLNEKHLYNYAGPVSSPIAP